MHVSRTSDARVATRQTRHRHANTHPIAQHTQLSSSMDINALASSLGTLIATDPGYVLLSWHEWMDRIL